MGRCVSGMRPTGKLHLGNYFGALQAWATLQYTDECLFFVADVHALTTNYADTTTIPTASRDIVLDWIAGGLEPTKCTIFRQSLVPEHTELALYLGMITPLSWLERVPTYKDIRAESDKDLSTFGFLGYPVLMAADILLYKTTIVPVGEDQLAHLELTREIGRRYNNFYGDFFLEPKAYQTDIKKYTGLDGRKMSKSYNNAIYLRDTPEVIEKKIRSMTTDTERVKRTDAGEPSRCCLYPYHEVFSSKEQCIAIAEGCRSAGLGCVDCKKQLCSSVIAFFEPIHARYREWDNTEVLEDIVHEGSKKARSIAQETMHVVRGAIGMAQ